MVFSHIAEGEGGGERSLKQTCHKKLFTIL